MDRALLRMNEGSAGSCEPVREPAGEQQRQTSPKRVPGSSDRSSPHPARGPSTSARAAAVLELARDLQASVRQLQNGMTSSVRRWEDTADPMPSNCQTAHLPRSTAGTAVSAIPSSSSTLPLRGGVPMMALPLQARSDAFATPSVTAGTSGVAAPLAMGPTPKLTKQASFASGTPGDAAGRTGVAAPRAMDSTPKLKKQASFASETLGHASGSSGVAAPRAMDSTPTKLKKQASFAFDTPGDAAGSSGVTVPQAMDSTPMTPGERSRHSIKLRRRYTCPEGEMTQLDIVQFTSPLYFVDESEKLEVDVMRLGRLDFECKVEYYTEDASAQAGTRYVASEGQIVFGQGEYMKTIQLSIIESDQWAATLEFKIHLRNAENCEIGQYLHFARVKIIDNDLFPSSKYEEEISKGEEGIERIPGWKLFMEYFKLNFTAEGVAWRTITILVLDQLHNIYKFMLLNIQIYLVDVLFNLKEKKEKDEEIWLKVGPEGGRIYTARLIAILYIVPMAILHIWDVQKVYLDLGGISREYLQANLFRKYLNYSTESRQKVRSSHMQVGLINDCDEVAEAYISMLSLLRLVGKLIIVAYFILQENPSALTSVLVMPFVMLTVVYFRSAAFSRLEEEVASRTAEVIGVVHEATTQYGFIVDYQQRPQFHQLFEERSEQLSEARLPMERMLVNNEYVPKWLGPVFKGVYLAMNAERALSDNGDLPLGVFLATISVFSELAENFEEAYEAIIEISVAVAPLRKLAFFLNMETDLRRWKQLNRRRRELTKQARLEVNQLRMAGSNGEETGSRLGPEFISDHIPLRITNMSYQYPNGARIFNKVNLATAQGNFVAVVGEHLSGKSTLLRLIGHNVFPTEGQVFIPTYLRIVHVSQEPVILKLSAWSNLTFGHQRAVPRRVGLILKALEMRATLELVREDLKKLGKEQELHYDELMGDVAENPQEDVDDDSGESQAGSSNLAEEEDEKDGVVPWQEKLSVTEKNKIHLARALIVNPEVLVLHRPFKSYNKATADNTMKIIHEHVLNRGVHVNAHTAARRRPRTCFFTPSNKVQMMQANRAWFCEKQSVIDRTPQELVWDPDFASRLSFFGDDDDRLGS